MQTLTSVKDLLYMKRKQGRYAFSLDEALSSVNRTKTAIRMEIARLQQKGAVQNIKKGFYLIIPPEYSSRGTLPVELYLNDLMTYVNKPYYIGLLSAAQHHGAAHQQVQDYNVVIPPPTMRDINKDVVHIRFTTVAHWPEELISQKKTSSGYLPLSCPSLTAADLVYFQRKAGSLQRVVALLDELRESINPNNLKKLMKRYPYTSTLQRLGYLIGEILQEQKLANIIHEGLENRHMYYVPLKPGSRTKKFSSNQQWKIIENISLASEA